MTATAFIDVIAPKLSREDELYALALTDLASQTLGDDAKNVVNGDLLLDPAASLRFFLSIAQSGQLPSFALGDNKVSTEQIATFVADMLSRVNGGGVSGSGFNKSQTSAAQRAEMEEILEGLRTLDADETAVLQDTADKVVGRLTDSLIDRLQPLTMG
jgi:aarF domain-containing kinase